MFGCLRVDAHGNKCRPKRRVNVCWDKISALDNEERARLREEEEPSEAEQEKIDDGYDSTSVGSTDDEGTDDESAGLPTPIIMQYCRELNLYGYADWQKLDSLPRREWKDLAHNVGILPEHERHLCRALGVRGRRRNRSRRPSSETLLRSPTPPPGAKLGANTPGRLMRPLPDPGMAKRAAASPSGEDDLALLASASSLDSDEEPGDDDDDDRLSSSSWTSSAARYLAAS